MSGIIGDPDTGSALSSSQEDLLNAAVQPGDNVSSLVNDAGYVTAAGVGAVTSVNGDVGDVVLDADDIDDTSTTNKFVTSTQLTTLGTALQPGDNVSVLVNDAGYIPSTQKAAANGVASLGPTGLIPAEQLPTLSITDTYVVASQAEMLALSSAAKGDVAVRTDESKTYILQGTDPSVLGDWLELLTTTTDVISVNGQIGNVVLDSSDIGLGNVDNTSDLDKPISTAVQAALDVKLEVGGNISDFTNDAGYVSSLGSIDGHTDVNLSGLSAGKILQYNGSNFVPIDTPSGGAASLADLSDVDLTDLTSGDILQYNGTDFVPVDMPSGGGSVAMSDLTDVDLTGLAASKILEYNGSSWVVIDTPSGGGGEVTFPLQGSSGTSGAPTYSFSSGTSTGMYYSGSNEVAFSCGGTLKLKVTASGLTTYDGIAFTANNISVRNAYHLTMGTGSNVRASNGSVTGAAVSVGAGLYGNGFYAPSTNIVGVTISNTERMRFDQYGLRMSLAGTLATPAIANNSDTNTGLLWPSTDKMTFSAGGVSAFSIDKPNNNVTVEDTFDFKIAGIATTASAANAYIDPTTGEFARSTSSLRYKTDVVDLTEEEVNSVLSLRPITYTPQDGCGNTERRYLGLLAEEVADVEPKLVEYIDIPFDDDDDPETPPTIVTVPDSVQYERVVVSLVGIVQKLHAEVEALKLQIGS